MAKGVSGAGAELLARQEGVIERQQALRLGIRPDVIDGLLRSGRWQRLEQGVYATFTGKPGRDAWLWAIVLRAGPGAMLSHRTAAGLSGLIEYPTVQSTSLFLAPVAPGGSRASSSTNPTGPRWLGTRCCSRRAPASRRPCSISPPRPKPPTMRSPGWSAPPAAA